MEPIHVVSSPLLTWAQAFVAGIVNEDRRARLSDEFQPDVVGEIALARLEWQDRVPRANAWLRAVHSSLDGEGHRKFRRE